MKKLFFITTLAALLVAFTFLPSLEGINTKNPIEKRDDLKEMIKQMQAEIAANGGTYTVRINSAFQYLHTYHSAPIEIIDWNAYRDKRVSETQNSINRTKGFPDPIGDNYIGVYTPAKEQGNCASCWAFAACAQLETAIKKKDGVTVDLSEQHLLSCNSYGFNCSGNGTFLINEMHISPGAVEEMCFPYSGTLESCECTSSPLSALAGFRWPSPVCDPCPYPYSIQSYEYVDGGSIGNEGFPTRTEIKQAIQTYGAVVCKFYANTHFSVYESGIFNDDCGNVGVNHAIQIIGWDDDAYAWRIKNSYGTDWGNNGLGWIRYGCCNIGYAAFYVIY
jgi:hypothetical protein